MGLAESAEGVLAAAFSVFSIPSFLAPSDVESENVEAENSRVVVVVVVPRFLLPLAFFNRSRAKGPDEITSKCSLPSNG